MYGKILYCSADNIELPVLIAVNITTKILELDEVLVVVIKVLTSFYGVKFERSI